jgi:hypothetical protein
MIKQIIAFICCMVGFASGVGAMYFQWKAVRNRRPDAPFAARWFLTVLFTPEYYSDEGLRARSMLIRCTQIFLFCLLVGLIIGVTTGG